jgi:hypothetical protein
MSQLYTMDMYYASSVVGNELHILSVAHVDAS